MRLCTPHNWWSCPVCNGAVCNACSAETVNLQSHCLRCFQHISEKRQRGHSHQAECVSLAEDFVCRLYVEAVDRGISVAEHLHNKYDQREYLRTSTWNTSIDCSGALAALRASIPQLCIEDSVFAGIVSVFENTNLHLEIENPTMLDEIRAGVLTSATSTQLREAHSVIGFPAIHDDQDILPPLPIAVGTGHYPTVAFMNHSCKPNVEWRSADGTSRLEFVALADIVEGEELFISYIDQSESREVRMEKLKALYGFTCFCPECGV